MTALCYALRAGAATGATLGALYHRFWNENNREVSIAETRTAKEALELVEALQRSDEEIKFIRAPAEGEIGVEMLRVLVNEEGLD